MNIYKLLSLSVCRSLRLSQLSHIYGFFNSNRPLDGYLQRNIDWMASLRCLSAAVTMTTTDDYENDDSIDGWYSNRYEIVDVVTLVDHQSHRCPRSPFGLSLTSERNDSTLPT
jgi:hypothetical protein